MIERNTLARIGVNALPLARIAAGPMVAGYLEETPPEERTLLAAGTIAAVSATDKFDGLWARRIGPTAFGGWLDQMADKAFIIPGQLALKNNGELPAVHPYLKIARDVAVSGLRMWAANKGRDVSAGSLGKRKTAAEMLTQTVAGSPLARNPDHIRAGASIATALSLTSFADYLFGYLGGGSKPRREVTTRNSTARRATASPVDKLVTAIDEKLPFITPDHLTEAGKALVLGAAVRAVKRPDKPALPTAMYTIGSLLDTLDGALARKKAGADGLDTTTEGMLKDVRSDKIQEIITFGALSMIARKRGNNVAADNYAAAAASAVLPALARAHAESSGFIVAEGGIGTRVGRGILGGVGMAFNRHQNVSDILGAVVATNNAVTTHGRYRVSKLGPAASDYMGVDTSGKFMHEASIKRKALVPLAAAGLAAGAVLLKRRSK